MRAPMQTQTTVSKNLFCVLELDKDLERIKTIPIMAVLRLPQLITI